MRLCSMNTLCSTKYPLQKGPGTLAMDCPDIALVMSGSIAIAIILDMREMFAKLREFTRRK